MVKGHRKTNVIAAVLAAVMAGGCAQAGGSSSYGQSETGGEGYPPDDGFKKVSKLVELPAFIPGMGELWVKPKTIPEGPFRAYDRDGDRVSTIYMISLDAMNGKTDFTDLGGTSKPVDHVEVTYNPGHPGVAEPHYHITLWHVSPKMAAKLK